MRLIITGFNLVERLLLMDGGGLFRDSLKFETFCRQRSVSGSLNGASPDNTAEACCDSYELFPNATTDVAH